MNKQKSPKGATHYRKILWATFYYKQTHYPTAWQEYYMGEWTLVFGKPLFLKPL